MLEKNTLVSVGAVVTVSFVHAIYTRVAFRKEQDARQRLSIELAASEYQSRVLKQIIDDRNIELTEEEARKLKIASKF